MTKTEFEQLETGDRVRDPWGGVGNVTFKGSCTYTLLYPGKNPKSRLSKQTFSWHEGKALKEGRE